MSGRPQNAGVRLQPAAPVTDRAARFPSYLLLIVLVAGAACRLHLLNQPFVDVNGWRESSTAMMAENIARTWNVLYPEVNWDGPGPSYNGREFQTVTLLAAVLYRWFGQADWVGRLVSVAFGVWGIAALYKLITAVWDRDRAIVGAALMAFLPGSVFVDREFLPDPAMVALITTACWLFVSYVQTRRPGRLVGATVFMALGCLTKLTGACVAIPLAYAAGSMARKTVAGPVRRQTLVISAAAAMAPVCLYYLWAWHLARTYPPHHFSGAQDFVWTSGFRAWLQAHYFLDALYWHLKAIWTPVGLLLVCLGFVLGPRTIRVGDGEAELSESRSARWFFHWWLAGAGAVYYLIGAAHLTRQPYNLHLFDPAAAALAGNAAITIAGLATPYIGAMRVRIALLISVAALALVGSPEVRAEYDPASEAGHQMGLALRRVTAPGDLVVTLPEFLGDPVAIYYSRRHGWVFPPAATWPTIGPDWDSAIMADAAVGWLQDLHSRGARWLGLVRTHRDRIWAHSPRLADYIEREFQLVDAEPEFLIYRSR